MRIVIMGPPGSGKGTQAAMLAAALGVPHLSTGDMLRAAAEVGDEFGERVAGLLARGQFVSDETALELVERRLAAPDAADGWILDGFPRTPPQLDALDGLLGRRGETLDAVILIEVGRDVVVRRILARAAASGSSARSDDTRDVAEDRYGVYERLTVPAVRRFEETGRLTVIDGEGAAAAVGVDIASAVRAKRAGGRQGPARVDAPPPS